MADQAAQAEVPANNNDVFLLPDEVFGPPDYEPVSFENLDQDTMYPVRMTTHDHGFVDLILQTTHAVNWRTADTVRPKLMATRQFKRVFNIEKMLEEGILIPDEAEAAEDEDGNVPLHVADVAHHEGEDVTMDTFTEILGDHGRAEEVFKKLPYAKDANDMLVPNDDWLVHDADFLMTYPVGKDFIKMEINGEEYGYVFFKKVVEQAGGSRRKRSSTRRSNTRRRRTSRRRRSTRRQRQQRRH
jgi:hypothetical protein